MILTSNAAPAQIKQDSAGILNQMIRKEIPVDSFVMPAKWKTFPKNLKKKLDSLAGGQFKITDDEEKFVLYFPFLKKQKYHRLLKFYARYKNYHVLFYHHGGAFLNAYLLIFKLEGKLLVKMEKYELAGEQLSFPEIIAYAKGNKLHLAGNEW